MTTETIHHDAHEGRKALETRKVELEAERAELIAALADAFDSIVDHELRGVSGMSSAYLHHVAVDALREAAALYGQPGFEAEHFSVFARTFVDTAVAAARHQA